MKTLGVTVAVFLLFWLPYGIMLSIDPEDIPAVGEKVKKHIQDNTDCF